MPVVYKFEVSSTLSQWLLLGLGLGRTNGEAPWGGVVGRPPGEALWGGPLGKPPGNPLGTPWEPLGTSGTPGTLHGSLLEIFFVF